MKSGSGVSPLFALLSSEPQRRDSAPHYVMSSHFWDTTLAGDLGLCIAHVWLMIPKRIKRPQTNAWNTKMNPCFFANW